MGVVETFLKLVQIDSLSFDEQKVAAYVVDYLKNIGFKVITDSAGKSLGGNSSNVIASLPAFSSSPQAPTILFNAHLDTVAPGNNIKPCLKEGVIRSDGTTILGADNKAGVAVILEAAKNIVETGLPHSQIEIVFTVGEEKGLLGAKKLDFSEIQADFAYVLDAEGDAGGIIVKAPSQNSIKAVFKGKSAHAGVNPEKGVNSIVAAAKAISYMRLGRLDFETTANIGIIKGGLAPNIVAPETVIEGEARSHSSEKLQAQTEHMEKCIDQGAKDTNAACDIDISRAYDCFTLTEEDTIVKTAINAISALGLEPQLKASGGGSDANVFNKAGIPAVNLSVGEQAVHSVDENISVKNLETSVEIMLGIVSETQKGR